MSTVKRQHASYLVTGRWYDGVVIVSFSMGVSLCALWTMTVPVWALAFGGLGVATVGAALIISQPIPDRLSPANQSDAKDLAPGGAELVTASEDCAEQLEKVR
jgi:hypothetical protein